MYRNYDPTSIPGPAGDSHADDCVNLILLAFATSLKRYQPEAEDSDEAARIVQRIENHLAAKTPAAAKVRVPAP